MSIRFDIYPPAFASLVDPDDTPNRGLGMPMGGELVGLGLVEPRKSEDM